ncbi:MAG: hypothetical protein JAY74_07540 [Candidatus Thiodiazotropha taylori]|nr:hypothetical protein [Candidatus Thiodiazotropha taylori]
MGKLGHMSKMSILWGETLMRNVFGLIVFLVLLLFISGCQSSNQGEVVLMPEDIAGDLKLLANARVFFGHQSVGKNIIKGLEIIDREVNDVDLAIFNYESYQADGKGCFLHTQVGKNKEPESKCLDFGRIIDQELSGKIDYALLKLCYVDISKESNVAKIFNDYRRTMDGLIARHPEITFVHATIPLMSIHGGIKSKLKELLGIVDSRKLDNIKRNEFNELLKTIYDNDPIVDIAESESTYPDGSREEFFIDGESYYSLVKDYTNDGGHLSEQGQMQVAKAFVQDIADIIRNKTITKD